MDICLFASGMGCYFSLEKDSDAFGFMKRRIARLAPTYLCFLAVWLIYRHLVGDFPLTAVLGNVLGIQDLTGRGNGFNWYISALLVFYFLAPYLKALADRYDSICKQGLILLLLTAVSIPFWENRGAIIMVSRLPVFYIGMLFAKGSHRNVTLGAKELALFALATVLGLAALYVGYRRFSGYLWSYGLHWYPFILITPGLCVLISMTAVALERWKWGQWVNKMLALLEENSFEIYLVHVLLYEALRYAFRVLEISTKSNLLWLCTFPVIALGCWTLKLWVNAVSRLWEKVIQKKKVNS